MSGDNQANKLLARVTPAVSLTAVVPSHAVATHHDHTPSTDPEEAFYFNSDDDALYMQLDMGGEARPMNTEADYNLTINATVDSSESAPGKDTFLSVP
jgi:hypothetical protein